MTKINIISGFLGAGKTTLIQKLLREIFKDEKVLLIENEFGEIGIDGGLLKETGIEIREINSGCICCSLKGEFCKALEEAVKQYSPDRILIEPSGVGKLSDVIKAVQELKDKQSVNLENSLTVADVTKFRLYQKNFGEFFNDQIRYADTILLSRTDKADRANIMVCREELRKVNSDASVITTPLGKLSGVQILEAMETQELIETQELMENQELIETQEVTERQELIGGSDGMEQIFSGEKPGSVKSRHRRNTPRVSRCDSHHHSDEIFSSWGMETAKVFTQKELEKILKELDEENGSILRAKGAVEGSKGEWLYFNMVPGEWEIRKGEPQYTGKVCVIGAPLDVYRLQALFEGASAGV